jgi:drug/metabolite transporter (DMT)-like permease
MNHRARRAYTYSILALVCAAVLWSTGGVLIKLVSLNPLAIAGMRSAFSAVCIFFITRKRNFTFSPAQVGGAISYCALVFLFVSATKLTTAANAILLQYTAPIYTALFARRYLQEKTSWIDWIIVAVVMGGILLFFLDNLTLTGYLGNILALLAGVAAAWLGLFLRKQKDASPIESILLGNVLTAIVAVPFLFGETIELQDWIGLALLGIVQLGFAYILYAYAIRRVRALDAMLIFMIEPILNPIWVFMVIGERPGLWALIGGAVVIFSVIVRSLHMIKTLGQ